MADSNLPKNVPRKRATALVQCPQCGQWRPRRIDNLKRSKTGDMCRPCLRKNGWTNRIHGEIKTPLYYAWHTAKDRCTNPTDKNYPNYGGRGITMCERWRESYESFRDDMGPHPGKGWSLDRIDNNRGYEPGNVRWANRITQANNRRTNHLITFRGATLTIAEWSEKLGIHYHSLNSRLTELGWSVERALTTPVRPKRR